MDIKKIQENGEVTLIITVPFIDMGKYIDRAAEKLSKTVTVKGFRPGKIPLESLRREVGDMVVLEEAARAFIQKEVDAIIDKEVEGIVAGRPNVSLTKLAWDNEVEMSISLILLPSVELANYKNRGIKIESALIEEAEMERVLTELKESRVTEKVVEREIKDGDKVVVDIKMFVDNVPVDGGQSKGVAIILGKNYIVPGFDKELIGMIVGGEKEFKLPFPVDHHQHNLAGKMVEFAVTVSQVLERIVPELNDDLAVAFGATDVADLKQNIQENMEHEKFHRNEDKAELKLLDDLIADCIFGPISAELIKSEQKTMLAEMKNNIERQGGKFSDYLLSFRKSEEDLKKDFAPDAEKRVKSAIILRKIIEIEKITPSEEDVAQELAHLLEHYGKDQKTADYIRSVEYAHEMKGRLAIRMVMDKLKEWNFVDYTPHNHEHQH
ncbi:trigger factor [Candidatus Falkowbacteria bacterium CG10_big_fil_rev_8_21_14_0_10_37_14]|uniref:Trigger factor n=1 Tax=Candidatus Falkowbacteria bacterium CG10_big_fil_rev_8_21_14_0_10_37_14 TaxID=1974561 RepID=A0A2M6WTC3_9BACT|nr:trigger factor [Candidatus Falkowbacteria bacterium]PIT96025.1 MAG: trigger factor [Candidatus Falkowbacteria bacterium CG10_big_fil_rev_8_21_14_0_10_37_14]